MGYDPCSPKEWVGRRDEAQAYFRQCLATREVLLRDDPKNIQRSIELMLVKAQLGRYEEAIAGARAVERSAPHHPGKLFSAACAYALSMSGPGEPSHGSNAQQEREAYAQDAFGVLRRAVASGYRDPWMLQHAPELQNLRGYAEYSQILGEMPKLDASSRESP